MNTYCVGCNKYKTVSDFSPKATNPKSFYKNCDQCRREGFVKRAKAAAIREEYNSMREKAISLRTFDNEQALVLLAEREAGVTAKELAEKYGSNVGVVNKTLRRARTLDRTATN